MVGRQAIIHKIMFKIFFFLIVLQLHHCQTPLVQTGAQTLTSSDYTDGSLSQTVVFNQRFSKVPMIGFGISELNAILPSDTFYFGNSFSKASLSQFIFGSYYAFTSLMKMTVTWIASSGEPAVIISAWTPYSTVEKPGIFEMDSAVPTFSLSTVLKVDVVLNGWSGNTNGGSSQYVNARVQETPNPRNQTIVPASGTLNYANNSQSAPFKTDKEIRVIFNSSLQSFTMNASVIIITMEWKNSPTILVGYTTVNHTSMPAGSTYYNFADPENQIYSNSYGMFVGFNSLQSPGLQMSISVNASNPVFFRSNLIGSSSSNYLAMNAVYYFQIQREPCIDSFVWIIDPPNVVNVNNENGIDLSVLSVAYRKGSVLKQSDVIISFTLSLISSLAQQSDFQFADNIKSILTRKSTTFSTPQKISVTQTLGLNPVQWKFQVTGQQADKNTLVWRISNFQISNIYIDSLNKCESSTSQNPNMVTLENNYGRFQDTCGAIIGISNQIFDSSLKKCTCSSGFYDNGTACSPCLKRCISCTNSTACTLCGNSIKPDNPAFCPCPSVPFFDKTDPVSGQCICQAHFSWNTTAFVCVINCSSIDHATTALTNSSCNCNDKFVWNTSTYSCDISCSKITGSISIAGSVTACACQNKYNWDAVNLQCNLNCSNITNASPFSPTSCACPANRQWNAITLQCDLICSKITQATTLVSTNVCNCAAKFLWNETSLVCFINCPAITNMTGPVSGSIIACICQSKYDWDPVNLQCNLNCNRVTNATGPNSSGGCICATTYAWNSISVTCVSILDCKKVPNGNGVTINSTTCGCLTSYIWHFPSLSCVYVINCTAQSFGLPTLTTVPYSIVCGCITNFFWNYTALRCQINCSKVVLANLSAPQPSPTACACLGPSIWNITTCTLPCLTLPKVNTAASQPANACRCIPKYIWNPVTLICELNCPALSNTTTTPPGNTACSCKSDYFWNSSSLACNINCSKLNNTVSRAWSATECRCQSLYSWHNEIPQCVKNCSLDPNSNGVVKADGSCGCKIWFVLDPDRGTCKINCGGIVKALTAFNSTWCNCTKNYKWSGNLMACIIDCSKFENSNRLMNPSGRECGCSAGYSWVDEVSGCVKT